MFKKSVLGKICAVLVSGIILVHFFKIVQANDPTSVSFSYNPSTGFKIELTPEAEADVSLYYVDPEGTMDAVFGLNGEDLVNKTCSDGVCVPDTVTYGVIKAYIEDEHYLYVAKFRVTGGFTILDEDFYENILPEDVNKDDYIESNPPDTVLLQLAKTEEAWLQEPGEITLSATPTIVSPTEDPLATAEMEMSVLGEESSSRMSTFALAAAGTPTLTPSPTPADPVAPGVCTPGGGWVNEYIPSQTLQTTQQDGLPVPAYRNSPSYGFNAPDGVYYATGVGGHVTYKYPGKVFDTHDADGENDISIYEVTLGRPTYPEEKVTVQVSQDGIVWFTLSQEASSRANGIGVTLLDIHETGLPWIQYIKLTDITSYPLTIPEADGFDINAIGALNQDCTTPTPTSTPTSTPTQTLTPTRTPTITLTPSPTPADPIDPLACVEGPGYLGEYITGAQTVQQDGLPVPAYRSLPSYAFGPPDAIYYTMGLAGNSTYKFTGDIQNEPGVDFSIFEVTIGRLTYPVEQISVEVSQDGTTWFPLSPNATSRFNSIGVTPYDFAPTGLSFIRYIRMTDITTPPIGIPEADGFDINAVVATRQTCPDDDSGLLSIRKFTTTGTANPGDEVSYVMEITATQDDVDNVEVIDLPPAEFKYVGGSWSAQSTDTTRGAAGNLKAGGITTEPTYASPGTWKLGNMKAGETVTISYKAKTNANLEAGVYTDLAWTQGEGGAVLGTGIASSYVNNEFVGSEVTLARNTQTTASVNVVRTEDRTVTQGDVLGASTSTLPATGASLIWIIAASGLFVIGAGSILTGMYIIRNQKSAPVGVIAQSNQKKGASRRSRIFRTFLQVLLALAVCLTFVEAAQAAAVTSIRITVPQDKVNTNTFRIGFVTMDSEDRPLTVTCWKKGPSDADFIPFEGPINVIAGGNSGFCNVTSSVVGASGANYQFMASAKAAESPEVFSPVVGTSFNNQTPGTPVNYRKEQSSCTYKIFFKAANDSGRTKKIEIYRSENREFTADSGTKVGEVVATSNEEKVFEHTVGDCGKKYYFVVRAFDDYGNGSGLIGDSEVTVNTTTVNNGTTGGSTTETAGQGAIPAQGGNVGAPGTGTGTGTGGQGTGEVEGEETEAGNDDNDTNDEEDVLGAQDDQKKKEEEQRRNIFIAVLVAVVGGVATYVYFKNKK